MRVRLPQLTHLEQHQPTPSKHKRAAQKRNKAPAGVVTGQHELRRDYGRLQLAHHQAGLGIACQTTTTHRPQEVARAAKEVRTEGPAGVVAGRHGLRRDHGRLQVAHRQAGKLQQHRPQVIRARLCQVTEQRECTLPHVAGGVLPAARWSAHQRCSAGGYPDQAGRLQQRWPPVVRACLGQVLQRRKRALPHLAGRTLLQGRQGVSRTRLSSIAQHVQGGTLA